MLLSKNKMKTFNLLLLTIDNKADCHKRIDSIYTCKSITATKMTLF